MSLERLAIEDFRCVERAELEFDPRCNLITGENASGKTSLLEAIFFLGRGRSFRSNRNELLIRSGAERFNLYARILRHGVNQPLGMRVAGDGIEARYAGRPVAGLAELATLMPVQAIDPEVHRLVEGGPQERRRYLDWGVFHVEPGFVEHWRRYQRALRQRNASLRAGQAEALVRAWDEELIAAGEEVAAFRRRYVAGLQGALRAAGQSLLGADVDISLHQGWSAERSLAQSLEQSLPRDRERGLTHIGPHRADLAIRMDGQLARDRVSRGQQKLLASAMLLGQLAYDAERGSGVAALLVDDPAAELDAGSLDRLLGQVLKLPAQFFVTALDPRNACLERLPAGHRFHVEHGLVTRLI
ncbi:MAG TPA: DNA replication/repair protein RecF [Steroidobacteraceae bacterium]|nr:DNA replication/repair protein RecF [Steroidobacteraceae bacterium]